MDKMDSFVLAIGTKKTLQKMQKDYEDLVCCVYVCVLVFAL